MEFDGQYQQTMAKIMAANYRIKRQQASVLIRNSQSFYAKHLRVAPQEELLAESLADSETFYNFGTRF